MNAIRFHYFLHRDSLICASIIVQRQPTILRLSQRHFYDEKQCAQPVVLGTKYFFLKYFNLIAPWSIRAHLLPNQHALLGDFVAGVYPVASNPNEEGGCFFFF
jgi:hypothetical protein